MIYEASQRHVGRMWGSLRGSDGGPVGEIWWIYHHSEGSSALTSMEGGEHSIADLVARGLLPSLEGRFPLLVKTLHPARRLSVQVHPGRSGGPLVKEETWIVLTAGVGAWMLGGMSMDLTREDFLAAVEADRAEEVLDRIELEAGDMVHIPPGTVHALGPRLEVLEIQRNCDVTYRLYDWGRTDDQGNRRELHLTRGLDAIDWDRPARPVQILRDWEAMGIDALYSIDRIECSGEVDIPPEGILFLYGVSIPAHRARCYIADRSGGSIEAYGKGIIATIS